MSKILAALILLCASVAAEPLTIRGFVFDGNTKEPLAGANVLLLKSNFGASTDIDGYFQLDITSPRSDDTLSIEFIGYKNRLLSINDIEQNDIIYLTPSELELKDYILIMGDKINILSDDLPHAKTTITLDEIRRYGSSEISDILKPVPSIRIEGNDLDGRKIQIRGSNSDEVNVYLDGILINNVSIDNTADLSIIPVEYIQKLEVVKGSSLALLGNGAFGGILNITSQQEAKQSYSIKGKYGSFDTQYLIGNINIPLNDHMIINYFGQLNQFSPEIEFFPSERYSAKSKNNAITSSKQNHHLNFSYLNQDGRINTKFIAYGLDYKKPNWESRFTNYLTAATYSGTLFSLNDLELQINHIYSDNVIKRIPAGSAQYISSYNSNRLNLRLAKKLPVKDGELKLLSEYVHNDLNSNSKVRDINWENRLYHAFNYENRIAFSGVFSYKDYSKNIENLSWETFLGLRGDFLATGDHDFLNMFGMQLDYGVENVHVTPYLTYGKNVKYPSLIQQTYARELAIVGRQDSLDTFLEPEYSRSVDGGVTITYYPYISLYDNIEFQLGGFNRTVFNSLLQRPFDDLLAHVQLGTNRTAGFDLSVTINRFLSYFTFTGSFMYLDIENPLLYAYKPQQSASAAMKFHALGGFYCSATYFYEGQSVAWYYDVDNVLQTEEIAPFRDVDLSIGYRFRTIQNLELDVQVAGYNVFDNSGFRYYYLKKRFLQASLAIRY